MKVTAGTKDEVDGGRVLDPIKCVDPSGIPTEIFCGAPVNQRPFQPTSPMTGFKTGSEGSDM